MSDHMGTGRGQPPAGDEPFARWVLRAAHNARHYLPLYVIATVWLVMVAFLPTVPAGGGGGGQLTGVGVGGNLSDAALDGSDTAGTGTATGTGDASQTGGTGGSAGTRPGAQRSNPLAAVQVGTGTTRGGVACRPGVRQIEGSLYAAPCINKFTGDNGGATYRGVTADTIKFAIRKPADANGPNAEATNAIIRNSGLADPPTAMRVLNVYAELFNQIYELYGRKVVFETFNGQGNGTDEAQSKGQEGACADATALSESVKPFAVLGWNAFYLETGPFSECAAARQLFVPFGAAYFAEAYYQRWHPYVWAVTMECERIGRDVAEYIGKRLGAKPARWAGDPVYKSQKRVYGLWIPDNDAYARCGNIIEKDLREKYNITIKHRFNYVLDVSTIPQQAAQGVVQFKAAGVSTLILATEFISPIFLTQQAKTQGWSPEWFLIGTALEDLDGNARLYDQDVVDGHMFGMSQLGSPGKLFDKNAEAYRMWKRARPNEEPPAGYGLLYHLIVDIFNKLQVGGPVLNPASIADGIRRMGTVGGADGPLGTWSYNGDHTAVDDSREIYWERNKVAADGQRGAFIEASGGRRFQSGQWPAEEPSIYPGRS